MGAAVWELPPEPPASVAAVWGEDGTRWDRYADCYWTPEGTDSGEVALTWPELLFDTGRVRSAPPDPALCDTRVEGPGGPRGCGRPLPCPYHLRAEERRDGRKDTWDRS